MGNKNKTKNRIKGFTLIEVMVSIMMVSIAFLGIYSATSKYSQQTNQLKETYVASLLGQEGVEVVRNIRDTNWVLGTVDWDDGLTGYDCSADPLESEGAQAAYDSTTLAAYTNTNLNIDGNNFYSYEAGTATRYKRQICIDSTTDTDILHVAVYVYWTGGKQTVIKEDLYNWKW